MPTTTARSSFWRGLRDSLPFLLVIIPFAVLFGAIAVEAGLSVTQVMAFSVVVVAGAAQFTALQLMLDNTPTVIVLTAALVVNLRMAMYSAALAPYLGAAPLWKRALVAYFNVDQTYALSHEEYERDPGQPMATKIAYFAGVAAPLCPIWYLATYIGAAAGDAIPDGYALDFAVPITFLALIAPSLKSIAHVGAAATSILVALLLAWMPSGTGLILAAIVAMMVGARLELWQERQIA